jgi:outer membrane protein TolC
MSGCEDLSSLQLSHPSVTPATQPTASLKVDASQIPPMYRALLAVDLPTVARVVMARNLDIQAAQARRSLRGAYESSVGAIFPSITPNITGRPRGSTSNPNGGVGGDQEFHSGGRDKLDHQSRAGGVRGCRVETAARGFGAARAGGGTGNGAAARSSIMISCWPRHRSPWPGRRWTKSEELLRIERPVKDGHRITGGRTAAEVAGVQQDLLTAQTASTTHRHPDVTLHLDASVMLVPQAGTMTQTTLVREDLPIDDMLVAAVRYRPDLEAVRTLGAAAQADEGAAMWGGLGPQIRVAQTFAPPPPTRAAVDTLYRQPKYLVTGGFEWSAATFGRIKSAIANVQLAGLDLDQRLDQVRAAVISAHQASLTAAKLIPIASQQVTSAEEALRLTQEDLKAGTGLTIDVLQAERAADRARLRYATALVRYNQSQINLLAAMGLIDETDVEGRLTGAPALGAPTEPSESAPK